MMTRRSFLLPGLLLALANMSAQDWVDRLDEQLSFATPDGWARGRLSGTVEVEGYAFQQPAPAFIDADGRALFNPRFTTFLDGQLGPYVYAFAQARVDRGFDPAAEAVDVRLDEYALRFTASQAFNVQVGRFATVVGNWVPRHLGWDNPLINAPLVYEDLTGVWDSEPVPNLDTLLAWAYVRPPPRAAPVHDKYVRLPVIWGPSYATGGAVSGDFGPWNYAVEVKGASLSSRPGAWHHNGLISNHPTVSGRIGFQPDLRWGFGFSASQGPYLLPEAAAKLPPGRSFGDYRQTVFGQDVAFAWKHWQVWAEFFEARFDVPGVGVADSFAYYVETRYKLTPRWFVSARWNEHRFGHLREPDETRVRWGADTWRMDVGAGFRMTAYSTMKAQVSVEHRSPGARELSTLWAVQLIWRY